MCWLVLDVFRGFREAVSTLRLTRETDGTCNVDTVRQSCVNSPRPTESVPPPAFYLPNIFLGTGADTWTRAVTLAHTHEHEP
eukprot:3170803-Prymnesium_polylepis.1